MRSSRLLELAVESRLMGGEKDMIDVGGTQRGG
jgi:hypothetical protein